MKLNNLSTALPALAVSAAVATPAMADLVYENKSGGTVQLYGQVSPSFVIVDDGVDDYSNFADSDTSSTRLGLRVTQPFGNNTFRFRFETALGLPLTSDYDQNGSTGHDGFRRTDIRHFDFSLGGDWGRVSIGQGSMAADGATEVVLSAVGANFYQFTGDANGLFQFRTDAGALSGVAVGDVVDTFDGSRRVRLRYDTPEFNGFSAAVAVGQNRLSNGAADDVFADLGLFYGKDFGDFEFEAALAYQNRDRDAGGSTDSIVGSAAIKLDNGLGFAVGLGRQTDNRAGRTDPDWQYVQISYDANWLEAGTTSFGVDYYVGSDFESLGSESESWGIGVIQELDQYNASLYATYRTHGFSEVTQAYLDVSTLQLGARWKF